MPIRSDAVTGSWVPGADASDFPLQNLPLCVFGGATGAADGWRIGAGIGSQILDVPAALRQGLLPGLDAAVQDACCQTTLNALFSLGRDATGALRAALTALLAAGAPNAEAAAALLLAQTQAVFAVPVGVGDYTDFLTSFNHAFNVGTLFRPDAPVLPNFKSLPIAYHGRSSSLVVSGEPVWRPQGQFRVSHHADDLMFGPTRRLDFEMELGAIIGTGNTRGRPVAVDDADARIAGLCLLNDWSARDVQAWESQPLGPFLGKNFVSTLSPWVVMMEALAPYRVAPVQRAPADPPPAAYLHSAADRLRGAYEIHTEVRLSTLRMREAGTPAQVIATALFSRDNYWTFAQMIAHHTVNGCNLRTGDLLGSGTISGPGPGTEGSLLELTQGGKRPLALPGGETRTFLEDGDEITLWAFCQRPGEPRIGFGECRGRIESLTDA